jgi:magnesium chelatase family protein
MDDFTIEVITSEIPTRTKRKDKNTQKGYAKVFGAQPALPKAHLVSIETDTSKGLHAFTIVGLPDKAVEEARDRLASAIKHSNYTSPKATNKKIVISLAPATLKKEGASYDVPLALSYLLASGEVSFIPEKRLFAGELGLNGELRGITGALSIAIAARDHGFRELFLPYDNAEEASLVSGIEVYGARSLKDIIDHLERGELLAQQEPYKTSRLGKGVPEDQLNLEDIRGQEGAKRAIEIAAAGAHNIALFGPPGTGKTMLARALASLLPPLTEDEIIEVTAIHSYSGNLKGGVITEAPFRSPHHSSSSVSIIGGGSIPKPGEVTLAHRGVLFLDEFPEFPRSVIDALRQPLEDKVVTVARAKGSSQFPANFSLVAALNPCPCGYFGEPKCTCSAITIEKYQRKISGPIADRIDMWVSVGRLPIEKLKSKNKSQKKESHEARARIADARDIQHERFQGHKKVGVLNGSMSSRDIEKYGKLSDSAEEILHTAGKRLDLSPRAFHRTIKLARTIADLETSDTIKDTHMLEALQYRQRG